MNLMFQSSYLGLSIHPVFGGWFAYRAVFIIPDVDASSLQMSEPEKLLPNDQIFYALTLFNAHWKDGRYRSVTKVVGTNFAHLNLM